MQPTRSPNRAERRATTPRGGLGARITLRSSRSDATPNKGARAARIRARRRHIAAQRRHI